MSPARLVGALTHYVGMDVIISYPVLEDIITVSHLKKNSYGVPNSCIRICYRGPNSLKMCFPKI